MRFPLPPGSTIGILGGGQLGRMLSLAAARLGFDTVVLAPEADAPAARVAARRILAAYDDPAALMELARAADVVTFEFENIPAVVVERLTKAGVIVAPGAHALAVAQDRLEEKTFLNAAGIATVAFARVDGPEDRAARPKDVHRMGGRRDQLERGAHLVGQAPVGEEALPVGVQLPQGRQVAVDKQVRDLLVGSPLRQLDDVIAAVVQVIARVADRADRRVARDDP